MNKRQEQKNQTRFTIRESAKQLFNKQGFEGTTSRQIAKQAGVALGTIFVHFKDKNAILEDILFEDIESVVQQAFTTLSQEKSTVKQLKHLAQALYSYYLKQPELSLMLLQNSLFKPEENAEFSYQVKQFINAITQLIKQGQQNAHVNQSKDASLLATTFMATYLFVLMGLLREELPSLEQALEQLELLTTQLLS